MARKNRLLMLVAFLLTVCSSALFIHGLSTQAIEKGSGDRTGFGFARGEKSGAHPAVSTIGPKNQPPGTWQLHAFDLDEGEGLSLKAVSGQVGYVHPDWIVFFKVESYRNWTTLVDINVGILLDTDRDPGTGCPDGTYPDQNTGIGADYLIVAGGEATEMWRWDPDEGSWDVADPIPLAYLDAPDNTNVMEVGVYLSDVDNTSAIDYAVCDSYSSWDWMPDTGHIPWVFRFCGDANGDGAVNIADAMSILNYLFIGGPPPACYEY